MASESSSLGHQAREQEIEKLAQEIGRLIQSAGPHQQADLKELAYALIREEMIQRGSPSPALAAPAPFNPLGSGVLILALGFGLSFVFGPVGVVLMGIGLFFIAWGAIISRHKG
jgi:hypothetical protein